jgi:hypothetical protein
MGTTQRITPGVTGEPNWGKLATAVTSIANTVEKEQGLGVQADKAAEIATENPNAANTRTVDTINKQQQKLFVRRTQHFKSALKNLIRTGGGRKKIAIGKSSSLGRAGIYTSKRMRGFISSVYSDGIEATLRKIGFGALKGKSLGEVIDFLMIYFADTSSGMDEAAANMASCQMLNILTEDVKTIDELEEKLKSLVDENKLSEMLCTFYGLYLFEHLSQRFEEKITQLKGKEVSAETFKIIKEDILGQVKAINLEKSISEIDWKNAEGKKMEEKIFNSIIQIFE